jgi:phosphatidylserine/phosphatidylglycerophosphate/cardiolipin synthase-like enzyme
VFLKTSFIFAFALLVSSLAQRTPYDEPVQETISDPSKIIEMISGARENIFLLTPSLTSETLVTQLVTARQRGISVYLVVMPGKTPDLDALLKAGVEIKTLPQFVEGVLFVDYHLLVSGGLIANSEKETLLVDTKPFGATILDQFRALWQAATPYGG